jgi:hypothetical protein
MYILECAITDDVIIETTRLGAECRAAIGYGMGPNSLISGISREAIFDWGNLTSGWVVEAEDMIIIMVEIFSEFFEDEIGVPFS